MKQVNNLRAALLRIPDDQIDSAVGDIMSWLHSKDHAVCIFTPEEVNESSLRAKDVEESMCQAGFETIRAFPADGFVDMEEEQ
jgi:hypothetical protein